ncbi:hypothetical protein BH23GEM10_BH23GEM10_12820 [soil metagenome]
MKTESTKETAEAALRELPSVIGAFVREDVHGRPREVHLLVRAGPNPRHLAYDVRDLLEERLGMPIDQRVISIAQIAPGREPGPLLRQAAGAAPSLPPAPEPEPVPAPEPEPAVHDAARAAVQHPAEARMVFDGITTDAVHNRMRVRVALRLDEETHAAEAVGLDTAPARLRAAAAATLKAVDRSCIGRARFEVEHVTVVQAFERDYVVVAALVSSPYLGRRPIPLVGAQPVEMDVESAAAFAALKAVNRTLSLVLRLDDSGGTRDRSRGRRS